jgi:aminoglycoside 6'-N-acetyltransferase
MEDCLDDYKLLEKWLSDPAVLEFYEGRDNPFNLEKVMKKFAHRTRGESEVTPCIIEYDDQAIGYIQYYIVDAEEYEVHDKIDIGEYLYPFGMDLFIGETEYWNMGIGTYLVKGMIHYLFENENADGIFIDPHTCNKRAIKCYEKSGFNPITVIEKRELHEGECRDSLIMFISSTNSIE